MDQNGVGFVQADERARAYPRMGDEDEKHHDYGGAWRQRGSDGRVRLDKFNRRANRARVAGRSVCPIGEPTRLAR